MASPDHLQVPNSKYFNETISSLPINSHYTCIITRQMLTASRGEPDRNFNCSINHSISCM